MMNSFQGLVKKNWDYRFNKFQGSLMAWSSRSFDSLSQRVEVLNMFSFSRIFYIAAVLPMPQNFIKRVDMSVGKFLWNLSGKLLRVSLQDIKLPKSRGGLGLICLSSILISKLLVQNCMPKYTMTVQGDTAFLTDSDKPSSVRRDPITLKDREAF